MPNQDQFARQASSSVVNAAILSMHGALAAATYQPSKQVASVAPSWMSTCKQNARARRTAQHFAEFFDLRGCGRRERRAKLAVDRREVADVRFLDNRIGRDRMLREVARDPRPAGEHREREQAAPEGGALVVGVREQRRAQHEPAVVGGLDDDPDMRGERELCADARLQIAACRTPRHAASPHSSWSGEPPDRLQRDRQRREIRARAKRRCRRSSP